MGPATCTGFDASNEVGSNLVSRTTKPTTREKDHRPATGPYLSVSPSGRLEVNTAILLSDKKVQDAIKLLRSIPLSGKRPD